MRAYSVPVIAAMLLFYSSYGQVQKNSPEEKYRLSLKSGSFIPQKNIEADKINNVSAKAQRVSGKYLVVIQFENIPNEKEKAQLKQAGIELLDYIPNNAYSATVTGSPASDILKQVKARAVVEMTPEMKMEPRLVTSNFPAWAIKIPGTIDVWISFPKTFSFEEITKELKAKNFDALSTTWKDHRIIELRTAVNRLTELAALSCIEYVQAAPKENELLTNRTLANSRASVLKSALPGQRNLTGDSVVIGVGDDANPSNHIDFAARLINRNAFSGGFHGINVMGIAGGAGIVEEKYTGNAHKATIISQATSNILAYAPVYIQDYGMVITNNSYGNITNDCATFGVYDLYSRIMDQQMNEMPNLQHVFAAGNSGAFNCSPYLPGYSNVLGGYQTAKNIISVGNTNQTGLLSTSSSEGPVRDGRIKPDITTQGTPITTTHPTNTYNVNGGTSMAAPGVAGGLALLYQRYRQLHGYTNPRNGLMKALLCNGATDRGNPGPDFTYGFGWMNLLRSVKMLEQNNYFITSVNDGATNTHNITIPSGLAQLKVMLYWNDSAAAVLASQALINDLDLEVSDPSSTIYYPQLLDTVPGNVNQPATTGVDHVNNIEQVVINNPAAGTYTFSVKGTTVPLATNHEYFLVFDTIPVSTLLTYPLGSERFPAGDELLISWDSYGNPSNNFTVQYSIDGGANWIDINTNVAADLRQLSWTIPAVTTDQAKIKLIHNGTGIESVSDVFTILGVPTVSLASVQCEGYIAINWTAVSGATDYEVMMLRGNEMVSVATITTPLTYTFNGLSKDSVYWVSVRARLNGNPGRRARAISRQPNNGTCAGDISNKDLKIDAIISPARSGRLLTSTELANNVSVTVRIKNLNDSVTVGDIPVSYTLGTDPPVNATIIAPDIAPGATYDYTFVTTIDLSAIGSYSLKAQVYYPGDAVLANDTLVKVFKQLDNPFIDLTSIDFLDDIETATERSYSNGQIGLDGLDRYDFISTSSFGRLRPFVNSGIAYSGNKALTLDSYTFNVTGTVDSLKGTFNLHGYDETTDDIRFDFMFKHHGQEPHAANKVWIRGADTLAWIEIYDLFDNQGDYGEFKKSPSFEVSDILASNSQNFASSFQVRFGERGQNQTTDNVSFDGYTFDDIHLYMVTDDIQMIAVDTPSVASCGLSAAVPIRVIVRNSANSTINNIPVYYQVDSNTPVNETIPFIDGNDTVHYTFTTLTPDLVANGTHTIRVWVDLASDSYTENDELTVSLNNSPIITSFPYLENFESGTGSWFTGGTNSSWQYGTPVSGSITGAASGSKAWKTNLTGSYNDRELSYLYSPCFNISGMTNPTLSLSIALSLEDCGVDLCDGAYVEYSADGVTWLRLGASGQGTNWYNKSYTGNNLWSITNYYRWHVATIPLPTGLDNLRLRFVLSSDPFVSMGGIGVDDIHIYDNTNGIYAAPPYTSASVNQPTVNGTGWINFTDGGKLVASINPNGQDLGSTNVQAYIYNGPVRNNTIQYYLNRNITIKPTNVNLADSATVRFYFLDSESEALINATGCGICQKPTSAYQLGVSKYSNNNDNLENGDISDNVGAWLFILPAHVTKVPFDKGYYAEFKVKDFSEFWLNNGGFGNDNSLPAELISFTAKKKDAKDVLVEWKTASESNVARYEVELARGNDEYNQNRFTTIGTVNSQGNSTTDQYYSFIDKENNKSGIRYYRLKTVDIDGRTSYSDIRPVIFNNEVKWQVYPNPSAGVFSVVYQASIGETVTLKVHDVNGKQILQKNVTANGFLQKTIIDLEEKNFASGLYLLEVASEEKKEIFRLIKK